jgi:hypothetical protein
MRSATTTNHCLRNCCYASCSVVTAGADETLRFWRVFGEAPTKAADKGPGAAPMASRTASIR